MRNQFGQVQLQRLREHGGQAWAHEVQAEESQRHGAASDVELKELVVDHYHHHHGKARAKDQKVMESEQDLEVMELMNVDANSAHSNRRWNGDQGWRFKI